LSLGSLAPLTVVIPLIAAAMLAGAGSGVLRPVMDLVSLGAALAVTVLCALILSDVGSGRIVEWLGGWTPRDGVALGIDFAIDGIGAGLALFVAVLFVMAFVFSWRYFAVVGPFYHALMLLLLGASMGFSYAGDLFDLFVFFELLSVAAYALTAYDVEEDAPLQGTLNFAVTNSVGAFLVLTGVGLLYARTGALNMAQIGEALAGHGADALVVGAFTLMVAGFFVKAAVVPFHFWLADAYAVAPTPVCLLLSAAVSELGLYALARVYWTVFSGVLDGSAVQVVLLVLGVVTAVLGAVMCFAQRHLKRMLAFATLSHVGLFVIGLGLLSVGGLAGLVAFVVADGMVKASLFVGVGALAHRNQTVDELDLRGRGRGMPLTAALWFAGGLAIASLPPFGPFLGKGLIEAAATEDGRSWVTLVFVGASVLTGAAVLRAGGGIFFGWGVADEETDEFRAPTREVDPELEYPRDRVPRTMSVPAVLLLVGGLAIALVPGLGDALARAAAGFVDRAGYAGQVLAGRAGRPSHASAPPLTAAEWASGVVTVLGAVGVAWASLALGPLRTAVPGATGRTLRRGLTGLRTLHSGHVGDYVMWLVVGVVVLGATFAASLT
jgi:multicomponent Na+:H+ antiporter subunit D